MRNHSLIRCLLVNLLFSIFSPIDLFAQQAHPHLKNLVFQNESKKYVQIPFTMVNNLMVIQVSINHSDSLNFIFDSGVTYPIVSDPTIIDELNFEPRKIREVDIKGWGTGEDVHAYHTWGNTIEIKGVEGLNQDIIYASKDVLLLSKNMGVKVHGLIGATIFNHFVVQVDYQKKVITLYKQDYYASKKRIKYKKRYECFPVEIKRNRCYMTTTIFSSETNSFENLNLLVDTGASHALSVFESENTPLKASLKAIRDHLGVGINGDLYGKVNRLDQLKIGDFLLENPIVKYPEFNSLNQNLFDKSRHGSIGSEVLRRFTVVFDYHNKEILLKKNNDFRDEFSYNHLGLEFNNPYPGLPYFEVSQIRELSPAFKAGIKKGDRLVQVNGQAISLMSVDEVRTLFRGKDGRKLSLEIEDKSGSYKEYTLTLEDPFK
ncbi:PDZ domain-containing protein [Flammeovirga agarivorans]|uniref:PDZ domain-containing protein n=1 Tax=Flammeovirga agarivorans TaxID=2726742 RepID=A0A7X8SMY1_9BACT|nr:PDZ domain-containing protein [Flammeovirga agarivorans]NLR93178.1 PDZ domain-containing protein [Flammeovirga agarivorans]